MYITKSLLAKDCMSVVAIKASVCYNLLLSRAAITRRERKAPKTAFEGLPPQLPTVSTQVKSKQARQVTDDEKQEHLERA